ncbi:MAG: bestrophin family ion channel, partial [Bacteroidota bacterium]
MRFAWKNLIFFTAYGAAVIYIHHELQHNGIDVYIPYAPLGTIGIAVAFYVGFKNNQSYDRFWEGRKIWGGIVNYSRTWGNQVMNYLEQSNMSEEELYNTKKRLIYRHIAWINALRLQLRRPSSFSTNHAKRGTGKFYQGAPGGEHWKSDVGPFLLDSDIKQCKEYKNVATQLVRFQGAELKTLVKDGSINEFEHINMMETLEESYNLQGKCERIKNTPLPRQYAYFSYIFTWIFLVVLPFGLVGLYTDMGHGYIWLTLPSYIVISWIFITMEKVG